MPDGWDLRLLDLFMEDDNFVLAAINPRGYGLDTIVSLFSTVMSLGFLCFLLFIIFVLFRIFVKTYRGPFRGNAEWNWMAFRSDFMRPHLIMYDLAGKSNLDYGDWFTLKAKK